MSRRISPGRRSGPAAGPNPLMVMGAATVAAAWILGLIGAVGDDPKQQETPRHRQTGAPASTEPRGPGGPPQAAGYQASRTRGDQKREGTVTLATTLLSASGRGEPAGDLVVTFTLTPRQQGLPVLACAGRTGRDGQVECTPEQPLRDKASRYRLSVVVQGGKPAQISERPLQDVLP